ncbi:hypothetical protein E0500_027420 [Streptomyces sp. KM273126]|uniref:DUF6153 family protein n=1 Tax=Streptomyces sp. KM273126 TaxID=2545247 RepID=UPI00103D9E87|nr:DUF6153 family protein [Streptomyces sp. KM273126]MBA2811029.1 hypothetical protein [Streptomyces sp. KM273126]
MKASTYVRAGGALGHLLLVVVLALGVFAMHSMGHPQDSSGSATSTASHATTMDPAAKAHAPRSAPPAPGTGADRHVTDPADPSHAPTTQTTHQPAMAMDMLSLCVAVLFGAWVLAALLRSAFARDQDRPAELLAQVAAAIRPSPPPRRPDLARLSVLRL